MRKSFTKFRVTAAAAFLVSAGVGLAVQGWAGVVLYPLAIAVGAVCVALAWIVLRFLLHWYRQSTRVRDVRRRVERLPTDELKAIAASPAHPEFGFAYAALALRGIEPAKPQKRLLLDMLVSPNPNTRGVGIGWLFTFYPEVRLPEGSSSLDPPEVWRERIVAMAGEAAAPTPPE